MDTGRFKIRLHQSASPEKGFTMVELLITLAILGLIISAAYNFYLVGLKCWNNSTAKIEACQNARIALDTIIRELRYASSYSFHEEGSEIRFTAPHDQYRTLRFRLVGRELVYDSYPTGSALYFHNKIALDINRINFLPGGRDLITIEIEAGSTSDPYKLAGAILPRNLPGSLSESKEPEEHTVYEQDQENIDE